MNGLLEKLKKELEIRNFSEQTVKGYLYSVGKFLDFSMGKGINEETIKKYIQESLEKKNPSGVRKDLFAIKFFFNYTLKILKVP